jgi:hypothetical protein
MIIVLEGPDNAGKSTLGRKLSADLSMDLIHPGGPPKHIVEVIARCQEQLLTFQLSTEVDFIYDRITCISDMIYRGRDEYKRIFEIYQGQLRTAKNVIIIYCRPSDERVKDFSDHVKKDHETDEVVQHAVANVDRIVDEYDVLMNAFANDRHITALKYDFERDVNSDGYEAILKLLKSRKDVR